MKSISNYFISPDASLREVIEVIDRGAAQIALVVDHDARLLGTVSDGDIRRALLRGENLSIRVDQVMHREFRALRATASHEESLSLMRREHLHQIPGLDEEGRVVRLFLLDDEVQPKILSNTVIIMAGGEGKRLLPITQDCPKPMIPVGGKPMLEIILEQCIDFGFRNFYFSVNYLKEQIQNYFCSGERWGVNINYIEESEPLGTAGALSLIPKRLTDPFLVLNGDVLTRVDYSRMMRFHSENATSITACVREYRMQVPFGVMWMRDLDILGIEEKPIITHQVNAGIYILDPAMLDLVPSNRFFDMPDLIRECLKRRSRVTAFPIHEYWLDVGLPETLMQAHREWE